jgi:hypothetical protein
MADKSKWRTFLQIFWDALFFFDYIYVQFFLLKNYKTNDAKHEISKWRPNSRWTPKRFYFLKIQNGRKIQYGRLFAQIHDFLVAETLNEML